MIFLLLSILTSSIAVLFFKLFERYGVNTFQAIVFNYITCAVLGNLLAGSDAVITTAFWEEGWFPYTILLGMCFISIFFTIGKTAQKLGVSVSMVAAKLSVVIPILLSVLFYGEGINALQATGILMSLLSVYFISNKPQTQQDRGRWLWVLPVIVFLGSGVIDSIFNHLSKAFNPNNQHPLFGEYTVTTAFSVAFVLGSLALGYQLITKQTSISLKNIAWGVALGIPNYFCMYFLVKTLGAFQGESAVIFPVNNIGIVGVSTLASMLLFREKLNRMNIAGLLLAIFAIALISFSR